MDCGLEGGLLTCRYEGRVEIFFIFWFHVLKGVKHSNKFRKIQGVQKNSKKGGEGTSMSVPLRI